jgi:hypothetical protein
VYTLRGVEAATAFVDERMDAQRLVGGHDIEGDVVEERGLAFE